MMSGSAAAVTCRGTLQLTRRFLIPRAAAFAAGGSDSALGQHHTSSSGGVGLRSSASFFSTSSSSFRGGTDDAPAASSSSSLRALTRPFLLLCHPDMAKTDLARTVNLSAVQTLNGLVDSIEAALHHAEEGSGRSGRGRLIGGRLELRSSYEIEFLVPSLPPPPSSSAATTKRERRRLDGVSTRRSVTLSFPRRLRDAVAIGSSSLNDAGARSVADRRRAARELRAHAAREIGRLLRVAGVPHDDYDEMEGASGEDGVGGEGALWDEMGLDDDGDAAPAPRGARFSNLRRPSSKEKSWYDRSRSDFVRRKIDWDAHSRRYEKALRDAEADVVTEGAMDDPARREEMVSAILGRVRVASSTRDHRSYDDDDDDGLDPLHQLIALRRLSLLFMDNFDQLQMEEMGRMWETAIIVLTPARGTDVGDDEKSRFKATSRRKLRRSRGVESGFKFAYGSEEVGGGSGSSRVMVYIPIDFTDDELIGELTRNLHDFYDLCTAGDEDDFEALWPEYLQRERCWRRYG